MKKGFTLVELLAVLAVISLILVVVIPNITGTSNKAKQKMYETKKESILKAYEMCVSDGETNCDSISMLIRKKYIVSDNVIENSGTCNSNCIQNPVDGTYLDDCRIVSNDIVCS